MARLFFVTKRTQFNLQESQSRPSFTKNRRIGNSYVHRTVRQPRNARKSILMTDRLSILLVTVTPLLEFD